jgi:O-antigen chain-terminating methyltransferase
MGIENEKNIPIKILEDDVFLVSYPKSGRTWLRFLIGNYLSGNQADFPNSYQNWVPDLDYNPQQCCQLERPRFIQSHRSYTPEFIRIVYIVRDGRDVAVSYYFHALKFDQVQKDTSFEDFLEIFNTVGLGNLPIWSSHVESWLNQTQIEQKFLLIKYEDLTTNTVAELIKILEFAGLKVDNNVAKTAVEMSQFEKLQDYEKKQEQILFKDIADSNLSFKFFRRGQVGDYKNYFDENLLKNFIKYHGSTLKRLDYLNNADSDLRLTKDCKFLNEPGARKDEMIEANNPEINVDELMQQVLEEVERRQTIPLWENEKITTTNPMDSVKVSYIEGLLNNAEYYSQVPAELPDKFNRFPFNIIQPIEKFILKLYGFIFKKQRVVNSSITHALRESLLLNQQLIGQVNALEAQVNALQTQISTLGDHMTAHVSALGDRITVAEAQIPTLGDRITATEAQIPTLGDRITAQVNGLGERLTATDGKISQISDRLIATDENYLRNDTYLKNDLTQQKRLISLFLEEAQKRLPEPFSQEHLQTFVSEEQHLLDAFYVAFEDRFRGSREDIFNRLKVYLPLLETAQIGTQESPILDVGCGRGEWLKLLQKSGYVARGLDINRAMLDECKARGLDVLEEDVITHLQSLPEASLGAVTGFHIIEHLPFPLLIKLLNETRRVIKPGGLAIFETPNPQNILVGSHNFYIDPTHLNPLPSSLTEFLVEYVGFHSVKILNLNAYEESYKVSGSEVAERFNSYFYGAQDYAVIGYKQ